MKNLLLIFTILFPALASAEGAREMGDRICREEVGEDLMARQNCLRDFQKSVYLVRRYYQHAGLMNQYHETSPFSSFFRFDNPFALSPRRVINKCSSGQLYNGNIFSSVMDFRQIWDCISDLDPEAAGWDTI